MFFAINGVAGNPSYEAIMSFTGGIFQARIKKYLSLLVAWLNDVVAKLMQRTAIRVINKFIGLISNVTDTKLGFYAICAE